MIKMKRRRTMFDGKRRVRDVHRGVAIYFLCGRWSWPETLVRVTQLAGDSGRFAREMMRLRG